MDEWGIFLVIVAIVGFLVTVTTPIIKLNTAITALNHSVKHLTQTFEHAEQLNMESHKRMWSKIDEHGEKLGEHEGRIKALEEN